MGRDLYFFTDRLQYFSHFYFYFYSDWLTLFFGEKKIKDQEIKKLKPYDEIGKGKHGYYFGRPYEEVHKA